MSTSHPLRYLLRVNETFVQTCRCHYGQPVSITVRDLIPRSARR